MRDNKFWDECNNNSIRQLVAGFIDKHPILSKYKDDDYYSIEDAFVEFIENNREVISREVDKEYQREDLYNQLTERLGTLGLVVKSFFPIERANKIISEWQERLTDNDIYWEQNWAELDDAIAEHGEIFNGLDNYEFEDVCVYLAYVKNWYENNDEPNQCPSCIDEFFDCEMADDDLREYYESLGNEIFRLFEELNEKCED